MFQGKSRFDADNGIRGGNPNPFSGTASPASRGGNGSDGQNPASSAGFKSALSKVGQRGNSLRDQLPNKTTFAGKGFKKPSYFAQGAQRHGMHIGAGAPHTAGANDTGADFGS